MFYKLWNIEKQNLTSITHPLHFSGLELPLMTDRLFGAMIAQWNVFLYSFLETHLPSSSPMS